LVLGSRPPGGKFEGFLEMGQTVYGWRLAIQSPDLGRHNALVSFGAKMKRRDPIELSEAIPVAWLPSA
jgi:hypothetical protein